MNRRFNTKSLNITLSKSTWFSSGKLHLLELEGKCEVLYCKSLSPRSAPAVDESWKLIQVLQKFLSGKVWTLTVEKVPTRISFTNLPWNLAGKKLCEIRVNLPQELVNQRASILCNRPSVLGSRAKLSILGNRKLLFKGEIYSTNPVILSQLTFGNWLRIWEKMKLKNPPFWILLSNLANYPRKFSSPP